MSGALFIVATNMAMAGLIAAAFLAIASYERTRAAGRWLAAAYVLGMTYYLADFAIRWVSPTPAMVAVSAAILLTGMSAFTVGLAKRYERQAPLRLSLLVVVLGTLVAYMVDGLPRHSFTRMMAFQGPYVCMQLLALSVVIRVPRKQVIDHALAVLLALSAIQFLSKPFLAHAVGGWGENPAAFYDSIYAMVSQAMGTVFGLALALMAMVVLARDLLSDATTKSETDTLSGLHNRRGFEARAAAAVAQARKQKIPVSLATCDLDHFKSVNDTFGHASGDRVIAAFAHFLRQAASQGHVIGRIGGEEFAVVLPGATLAMARLFAEGARAAFGAMEIEGLPKDKRFTASFGVSELGERESLEDMMLRADEALYLAKRSGRDRVRLAREPGPSGQSAEQVTEPDVKMLLKSA